MNDIEIFFKKMGFYNKDYFNKIKSRTLVIDNDYENIKEFVGFYPDNFKLVLPKIKNTRDILIWIHEYSHALFPEDTSELFPNIMESIYINNYVNEEEKVELKDYIINELANSNSMSHTISKKIKLKSII